MRVAALILGALLTIFGGGCTLIFLADGSSGSFGGDWLTLLLFIGIAPLAAGLLIIASNWKRP